jgi:hypothetical protein
MTSAAPGTSPAARAPPVTVIRLNFFASTSLRESIGVGVRGAVEGASAKVGREGVATPTSAAREIVLKRFIEIVRVELNEYGLVFLG